MYFPPESLPIDSPSVDSFDSLESVEPSPESGPLLEDSHLGAGYLTRGPPGKAKRVRNAVTSMFKGKGPLSVSSGIPVAQATRAAGIHALPVVSSDKPRISSRASSRKLISKKV